MPQYAKGPRLYRRRDTGIYLIRDTGVGERSTGSRNREEAEKALAIYITQKDRPSGPANPDELTIVDALNHYMEEHAIDTVAPERIGYAVDALLKWWGMKPVSAITKETCRAYGVSRKKAKSRDPKTGNVTEWQHLSPGTVRRELGTLQAAITHCYRHGRLLNPPAVFLPKKPEPKDRWLNRSEAAQIIWAAWRNPKSKHLARFILVALYTGTRRDAILGLSFSPNTVGGWVDTEHGILFRRGAGQVETNKRTPRAKLPDSLLAHLRRWEASGARFVVEIDGNRVASVKTAWRRALLHSGIPHATVHSLRHTAITWAMQGGADPWEAGGFFGVSPETMQRVYAHHHPDHQETVLKSINARGRKL